ncbi:MAG: FAD-dependent oxidoreductase [Bacilli bacterium]|jgi:thioredoxin reductase (NADPH)
MFDTIIIGGGPSGMAAALNVLRNGRSALILEKENFGGQIANSPRLENYPSIEKISGLEFSNNLFEQISKLGVEFELEDVEGIKKVDDHFVIKTNYGEHEGRTVVIATGCKHRTMGIAREEELVGKGVSYCATCDGHFFENEDVVVIGDANTALQYALDLSTYCKSVKICTLFDKWFADDVLVKALKTRENITYEHNLSLQSFDGKDELTGLTFKDTKTNEIKKINCKGVFVAIGQIPDNENFKDLVELEKGFVVTNDHMETKTPGIYAVGDCRKKDVRQVITALNDGSIAAVYINKYLN